MPDPLKILLLEDEPNDAEMVTRELVKDQFATVRTVATRQDFEAALAVPCDVVLADQKLAGWDGLEALAIVQQKCPLLPVIILSGNLSDAEAAVETIKRGAADYVQKDRRARLPKAIANAMEKKRLQLQLVGAQYTERTPAQRAALRDAYRLLSAQFDDILIVCSLRADHEAIGTDMDVFWQGGWPMANTLADFAKQRISYQRRPKNEPQ